MNKINWSAALPVIVTITATLGTAILTPSFLVMHPLVFSALNAAAMLLHAALPSVFGLGTGSKG